MTIYEAANRVIDLQYQIKNTIKTIAYDYAKHLQGE